MIKRGILLVVFLSVAGPMFGETVRNVTYQGQLSDENGKALPDGIYTLNLSVYDRETAAENKAVWKDTVLVQAQTGYYQVILGTSPAAPLMLESDRNYWIGIKLGSAPELKPRCALKLDLRAIAAEAPEAAMNSAVKEMLVPEIRYGNNSVNVNTPKIVYGKDQSEAGNKRILFPPNYFNNPPIVLCSPAHGNETQWVTVSAETTGYADIKTAVWNGKEFVIGGYIGFNWMAIGW